MKEYRVTYLPNYQDTKSQMGIEDYDDYNSDAVLFQQGFNMKEFYVTPGETFEITQEHQNATFQCEDDTITLRSKFPEISTEVSDENFGLENGTYRLSQDTKILELIERDEFF